MGLVSLLRNEPTTFLLLMIPLLYSVILHEIAHGLVALWFGDTTAKRAGRLTLNPINHVDPFGALMLFVVGFGWAKPVPVNYAQLKNSKVGVVCVSLAGCLTNIAIASVFVFLLQLQSINSHAILVEVFSIAVRTNIVLGAFNLIPIPPLDGSRVVTALLPEKIQMLSARFERYGFLLVIALLYTGVLFPAIQFIEKLIYRFIGLLFGIH